MKNKKLGNLIQKLNQAEQEASQLPSKEKIEFLPDELSVNVLGGAATNNSGCSCPNSGCTC